jgi:hypothetical protein
MGGSVGAAIFGAVLVNRFGASFQRIAPTLAGSVPSAVLATFQNPQALMDPATAGRIRAGGVSATQLAPVVAAVKQSLAAALHDVFTAAAVVTLIGVAFTLKLTNVPLRATNRSITADLVEGTEPVGVEPR